MSHEKLQKKYAKKQLNWYQNIVVGFIGGATEVLIDHPLWTIKTRLQTGQTVTLNLTVLYRGIVPNAASMAPITSVQVLLNHACKTMLPNQMQNLPYTNLMCAFMGGIGSAWISCPTEMLMTYQGKIQKNFVSTGQYLIHQYGWSSLLRGLPATAAREGIFTAAYLAITPSIKISLKNYMDNEYAASLLAGFTSGIVATVTSHPFDTIKTLQQASETPYSVNKVCRKLYSEQGALGFFKGAAPRGLRVIFAITILSYVNEKLTALIQDLNDAGCEVSNRHAPSG